MSKIICHLSYLLYAQRINPLIGLNSWICKLNLVTSPHGTLTHRMREDLFFRPVGEVNVWNNSHPAGSPITSVIWIAQRPSESGGLRWAVFINVLVLRVSHWNRLSGWNVKHDVSFDSLALNVTETELRFTSCFFSSLERQHLLKISIGVMLICFWNWTFASYVSCEKQATSSLAIPSCTTPLKCLEHLLFGVGKLLPLWDPEYQELLTGGRLLNSQHRLAHSGYLSAQELTGSR